MEERAGGGALEGTGRTEPRLLQFDEFRVDPAARALWRGAEPVSLTPKSFSILLILLERPGEVVSKDELLRRAWDRGTASEASLTQCISALRKALGESASERRYVITVPGQGYCFGASVIAVAPEVSPEARHEPRTPSPAAPRWRRRLVETFAILLVAAAVLAWTLLSRTPRERDQDGRPVIAVLGFRNLSGREEDRLAAALAGMLKTELTEAGGLRVVPEDRAELILSGSFLALGERAPRQVRLDLRVIQVNGGETLVALAEVGSEERLAELVERAAARLVRELDVSGISGSGSGETGRRPAR